MKLQLGNCLRIELNGHFGSVGPTVTLEKVVIKLSQIVVVEMSCFVHDVKAISLFRSTDVVNLFCECKHDKVILAPKGPRSIEMKLSSWLITSACLFA